MFHKAAKTILDSINSMNIFITQQKDMTLLQIKQLQSEIINFTKTTTITIDALKKRMSNILSKSQLAHQHIIIIILYNSLKNINQHINKIKSKRIEYEKELDNIKHNTLNDNDLKSLAQEMQDEYDEDNDDEKEDDIDYVNDNQVDHQADHTTNPNDTYEQENVQLFKKLAQDQQALYKAEKSIMEISEVMNLFNTKLVEQEELIQSIYDNSVNSVSYVQHGNTQLKKALEHGASYRVGLLFFFIVASLSLLFLDWYT